MKRKDMPRKRPEVRPTHLLVGTWEQTENPFHRTTAVFTVAVKDGRFQVTGLDESDGVAFKISNTRWDGKCLRFVSLFPTTKHKAKHAFCLIGRGRDNHNVAYTAEEGAYTDDEKWGKRSRTEQ